MSRIGVCSINGCNRSIYAKTMCRTHYMKSWKTKWNKYIKPVEKVKGSSKFGVYKIECNGKCYIGGTTAAFHLRWRNHLYELRKGTHHNYRLQDAFNEYGEQSFNFSILEIADNFKDVTALEQKYIDTVKPKFNISLDASCGLSDEARKRRLLNHKGTHPSEETRRKISEANKGNKYALGYKHTEETKRKISEAGRSRKLAI